MTKESEDFMGLTSLEQAQDQGQLGSFLLGPQEPMVHMVLTTARSRAVLTTARSRRATGTVSPWFKCQ
jgi:hypothetical protein